MSSEAPHQPPWSETVDLPAPHRGGTVDTPGAAASAPWRGGTVDVPAPGSPAAWGPPPARPEANAYRGGTVAPREGLPAPQASFPGGARQSEIRVGARVGGQYAVVRVLGQGAMGTVFLARDIATGREVAIKTVRRTLADTTRLERFQREGETTALLDHPGILRVHAAGEHLGTSFLVYELAVGAREVDEVFAELDLRERVVLLRDLARALGHAHARGVIHRDVKPANVLVDAEGRVRLADFGLARHGGAERLTQTGDILGTPTHMAPEVCQSQLERVGPPADVWSVGVMLYEATTGRLPFEGASLVEFLSRIVVGVFDPPRTIDPAIAPALEAICVKALAPSPEQRYPEGNALADDLDRYLRGGRVEALPASRAARGVALIALALLAALLIVGGAIALRPRGTPSLAASATPAASVASTKDAVAAPRWFQVLAQRPPRGGSRSSLSGPASPSRRGSRSGTPRVST